MVALFEWLFIVVHRLDVMGICSGQSGRSSSTKYNITAPILPQRLLVVAIQRGRVHTLPPGLVGACWPPPVGTRFVHFEYWRAILRHHAEVRARDRPSEFPHRVAQCLQHSGAELTNSAVNVAGTSKWIVKGGESKHGFGFIATDLNGDLTNCIAVIDKGLEITELISLKHGAQATV